MDPSQNHFIKFACPNSKYGKDRTNRFISHMNRVLSTSKYNFVVKYML